MEPINIYRVVITFTNGLFDSSTYEGISELDVLAQISLKKFLSPHPIMNVTIVQVEY